MDSQHHKTNERIISEGAAETRKGKCYIETGRGREERKEGKHADNSVRTSEPTKKIVLPMIEGTRNRKNFNKIRVNEKSVEVRILYRKGQ